MPRPPSPRRYVDDAAVSDPFLSLKPREPNLEALEQALATRLIDATAETKDELRRLAQYRAPPSATSFEFPKDKLAAVLVLLHVNPLGELSVTLTTRSSRLRSHPGETALPGGRWEEGDGEGGVWTAYREAYEEIGLPLPPREAVFPPASSARGSSLAPTLAPSHLLHLTTLPPFTSRTLLVVLPVVALLVEPAATASTVYLPKVLRSNPDEVAAVFHLPLRAFLLRPPRSPVSESASDKHKQHPATPTRVADPHARWTRSKGSSSAIRSRPPPGTEVLDHEWADFTWLLDRPYRLHSFSSPIAGVTPSAVTGLTADIVVRCGMVAESGGDEDSLREPGFEREAEGQMGWEETIQVALGIGREGKSAVGLGGKVEGKRTVKGSEGSTAGLMAVEA